MTLKTPKHTPGPWELHMLTGQYGTLWKVLVTVDNRRITVVDYRHIAVVDMRDEAEANARLIAAAPDLLTALRNITECAEAGADGANMDLWIEQAHAAIAKATGQGYNEN